MFEIQAVGVRRIVYSLFDVSEGEAGELARDVRLEEAFGHVHFLNAVLHAGRLQLTQGGLLRLSKAPLSAEGGLPKEQLDLVLFLLEAAFLEGEVLRVDQLLG